LGDAISASPCGIDPFFLQSQLFVASTAGVAAAATVGMAVCTSSGTVVLTAFFNRCSEVDNAQAGRTGAFHLGDGGHFALSW
jgi:hypothetical protein